MFTANLFSEIINLTLQVGETYYLHNSYTDSYSITNSSTNDGSVVSVYRAEYEENQHFTWAITGLRSGVTTVTIFYLNNSVWNVYVITVVEVNSISIPNKLALLPGDSYTFSPVVSEAGATTTFTWQSSDNSVASVDESGTLTAVGVGTAYITCIAANGVSAQCEVVVNPVLVSEITLDQSDYYLNVGSQVQLHAVISPSNATINKLSWRSSNEMVAIVGVNGLVTGVSEGICNVTATSMDGTNVSANCLIRVVKNGSIPMVSVTSVTLDKSSVSLQEGDSVYINAIVLPSNASNRRLSWTSSNSSVCSVEETGKIMALSIGNATINATTTDGTNLSASCEVTVTNDSQDKEAYAVLNQEGLLAFYYDSKKGERSGLAFAISSSEGDNNPSWNQNYTKITKVCFDTSFSKYRPTNTSFWFSGCFNLKDIEGIANLNTSEVVSMREMFGSCSNLQSLDVSHFNTSKVTNMHKMFIWCGNLTELDVSNFDTSNVTDMKEMFNGCSKLKYIDVSHFDTGKAVFMDELFHRCYSLESVDVSNFKTDQTDNLHEMFKECRSLVSLDLSSFNTKQVTQMYRMFWGCTALKTIYVGNRWSTEKVDNSDSMFRSCSSLVGGKGTTFDENHIDHTYAHVDGGVNNPGYLTGKTEPTSNVWGDLNGDGVVDVADIAVIINIIASQTRED